MDVILSPLLHLLMTILHLYTVCVFVHVIMSWLIALGILNAYNQFTSMVHEFLFRITEPALRPIRKILPHMGGIDLSPLVLILLLYFLREILTRLDGRLAGIS